MKPVHRDKSTEADRLQAFLAGEYFNAAQIHAAVEALIAAETIDRISVLENKVDTLLGTHAKHTISADDDVSSVDGVVDPLDSSLIARLAFKELSADIDAFNLNLVQSKHKFYTAIVNQITSGLHPEQFIELHWTRNSFSGILSAVIRDLSQSDVSRDYCMVNIRLYLYPTGGIQAHDLAENSFSNVDYAGSTPSCSYQSFPIASQFPFDEMFEVSEQAAHCIVKQHEINVTGPMYKLVPITKAVTIGSASEYLVLLPGAWLLRDENGRFKAFTSEQLAQPTIELHPKKMELGNSLVEINRNLLFAATDACVSAFSVNPNEYIKDSVRRGYSSNTEEDMRLTEMVESYNRFLIQNKKAVQDLLQTKMTQFVWRPCVEFNKTDFLAVLESLRNEDNAKIIDSGRGLRKRLSQFPDSACTVFVYHSGELVVRINSEIFQNITYPGQPDDLPHCFHRDVDIPFNKMLLDCRESTTFDSPCYGRVDIVPITRQLIVGHGDERRVVPCGYAMVRIPWKDPEKFHDMKYDFVPQSQLILYGAHLSIPQASSVVGTLSNTRFGIYGKASGIEGLKERVSDSCSPQF